MEPQHPPPHQPYSRPSLFGNAPPPPPQNRQYGPLPSSRPDGRALPTYDPLYRPESEPPRSTTVYGYPPHSYAPEMRPQSRPLSPVRFGTLRPDAPNGYSVQTSPVKHNGGLMKEQQPGILYREGISAPFPPQPLPCNMPPTSSTQEPGSPVFASGGPQEPPGHSFGSRQMPPPSPPQHYPHRNPSASQPLPPSFAPREPIPGPTHRPGSSMSISSMLGSDAERPSRDPQSTSIFSRPSMSSSSFGAVHPPAAGTMSPPTAPARPASSLDHPLFRRSQTPDKLYTKTHSSRQSRSGSGGAHSTAPEASKFGLSRSHHPFPQYAEKPSTSQASPQNTPTESPYNHSRRLSLSGPIPSSNSQPQHEEVRGPGFSPRSRTSGDNLLGSGSRQASYPESDSRQPQRYNGLYSDRAREEQAARDRERVAGHEPDSKAPGSLHGRYGSHLPEREVERPHNAPSWEPDRSQPLSPESRRFPAPAESGSGFGFGAIQSYTKSLGSQLGPARQPPLPPPQHSIISIQPRQGQPTPPPNEQSFLNKLQTQPRVLSATSVPPGTQPFALGGSTPTVEEQRRKGSDDLMQHRSLLGIGVDGKRAGRASPLPQAVQGAQAQIIGPAGESSIKGELGRVFAGIGSGVGTGTTGSVGSGPSTPMTASPFKRDSGTGRSESTEDGRAGRGAAGLGRKRSSKEDEGEGGDQPTDARSGAMTSRAGARRGRHLHHHHHHHHHHRHKNEEEIVAPRPLPGPLNNFGGNGTPTEVAPTGPGTAPAAHHHHHHHHHHHIPRPASSAVNTVSAPPPREAQTIVNLEPLLRSVAHLPRHHLGSTLYAPHIGVPSPHASLDSQKFGYTSTPVPISRFDGKENCTFTVRVPRFRIDASHREEICARRAIWGTGVFTDDSDPVAAAIHSGFIRGEWGEDVDISMLDLEFKDGYQQAPRPPADPPESGSRIPPVPPANKDLHITLLLLPRLEYYASTLMFGLKSRAWDGTHDGMSFKVERIEWVDEGSTRGEERSGAARRKRLRNMMQSGRICTGPGLLRMRGGPAVRMGEGEAVTATATTSAPVEPVS